MSEIELGPEEYRVEDARPEDQTEGRGEPSRAKDCFLDRIDVVLALMVSFGLVFLAEMLLGGADKPGVLLALGGNYAPFVDRGEVWRFITANFLHGNLMHIVVNGYSFWILGRFVEKVYGRSRLFLVFLVTASLAAAVSWLANASLSVGASGGITGLLGLLAAFTLHYRERLDPRFRKSFLSNLALIIGINVMIALAYPGIDNWAHAGGFAAGFLAGFIVRPVVLFGGGTGSGRIRLAVRAVLLLLILAWTAQLYAFVFSVVIPEKGPARILVDEGGRYRMAYPAFFELAAGKNEEAGSLRISNNLNRTMVLQLFTRQDALSLVESARSFGALVKVTEGMLNGQRVIRLHGPITLKGQTVILRMALIEAPAGSSLAGNWATLKSLSRSLSTDTAVGRLLEAGVRSFVFIHAGII